MVIPKELEEEIVKDSDTMPMENCRACKHPLDIHKYGKHKACETCRCTGQ